MILETSTVKLYYEKSGEGPPLILLHGNGEDHTIFTKAIARLEKKFCVYAIDTRGHGKSSAVAELHYEDMARDVYEFICKLKLEKPVVYGFSDGGIVALLLSIHYPRLLSKAIVSGVNVRPAGLKFHWLFLFWLQYIFTRSQLLKLMLKEPDITGEMLQKIEIPVDITMGSRDMIRTAHLHYIARHIAKRTVTVFSDETHGSYVIDSEKIAAFIEERGKVQNDEYDRY